MLACPRTAGGGRVDLQGVMKPLKAWEHPKMRGREREAWRGRQSVRRESRQASRPGRKDLDCVHPGAPEVTPLSPPHLRRPSPRTRTAPERPPVNSSSNVPGSGTGTAVTVGASRPSLLAPNRSKLEG